MNLSGDLVSIQFHGDTIYAVEVNAEIHVILKPAFEAIGVDADQQIRKLQSQPWSCTGITPVQVGGQVRNMIPKTIEVLRRLHTSVNSSNQKAAS